MRVPMLWKADDLYVALLVYLIADDEVAASQLCQKGFDFTGIVREDFYF